MRLKVASVFENADRVRQGTDVSQHSWRLLLLVPEPAKEGHPPDRPTTFLGFYGFSSCVVAYAQQTTSKINPRWLALNRGLCSVPHSVLLRVRATSLISRAGNYCDSWN